ncbi:alpha/beta fold hydrolase [Chelatococcus asaccharovorans]|uniref:alpha/beta fold hydrolase n=1 Tax=Chelatococcus asaccharovorans TaxID=28210 RepID=UPI00224C7922|nr:alpha/beta fold hydrolase [Chelatococcus asaccharovorans]CAH1664758.1 Haloalkane dehalogenase [Chelatococcus asaccharovorans]CAH1682251.1 Haloalkane dehalogenase [Chelatococcus asaccharovorans]
MTKANSATINTPAWLDRAEYPFTSRFFNTPSGRMHYLDEGRGETLIFVHGNPSWSFEYRELISHFRKTHRCVAPDHIGFGLSDKPYDKSYLPQFHVENLNLLLSSLDIDQATLIMHDWGGPIGMSWALDNPERVSRLVVCNSWFWSVRDHRPMRLFSKLAGGPLGRFLCRYFNFFPRVLMPASFGDKARLTPVARHHFLAPFPTPRSRKGTWVFPRAIVGQSDWLEAQWRRRAPLSDLPLLLLWGMKDAGLSEALLTKWEEAFPRHSTERCADVGHNVPEELGDRAIAPIERFLTANPIKGAGL